MTSRRRAAVPAPASASPAALALLRPGGVPARDGLVARPRLVRRLAAAPEPVVLIVAPAGYGKTTLLEAWDAADPRPFTWLGGDPDAPDPSALLRGVMVALRRLAAGGGPFVLVVEDADGLRAPALRRVAARLPRGSALALACRGEPPVALGGLRAQRQVLELGARDLAMTRGEAAELLRRAGVELDAAGVNRLVACTEGWPAALYLAATALADEPDVTAAVARFGGDDRVIADFLRDEFLARLPDERVAFLTRASILDPLTGPLCDAVLDCCGSGRTLRELERGQHLVVALDRNEQHFRYHPLFAQMLRAELHRADPGLEARLHRRAGAWYEALGDAARAIDHLLAAGDVERGGDLLWRVAPAYAWGGRVAQLERWLARLPETQVARRPALALTAAMVCLVRGEHDRGDRWAAAAERLLAAAPPPPRPALDAGVALLRAARGRDGAAEMRRQAARAAALEPDEGPWRSLCCLLEGVARGLTDDAEGGRVVLEEGVRSGAVAAPAVEALCLAELALAALLAGDWEHGASLAERAASRVDSVGLDEHAALALVCAVAGFARAHRGRLHDARRAVGDAERVLARRDGPAPWYEAHAGLALARAELRLSNVGEARALLATAARAARRMPDAAALRGWIDDAWGRADRFSVEALAAPSSLTAAELRVLGYLPSHLSFREIAERLHVSANTVKTQAHAVYRKLDASSRSGAVAGAGRLGLLEGSAGPAGRAPTDEAPAQDAVAAAPDAPRPA